MSLTRTFAHFFVKGSAVTAVILALSSCSHQGATHHADTDLFSIEAETSPFAPGFPSGDQLRLAVEARAAGRFREARVALESVHSLYPSTPAAARAAFMLGTMSIERMGAGPEDFLDAARLFEEARSLKAVRDYAIFYQARAYAGAGDPAMAISLYDELLQSYPDTILRPGAVYGRATALDAAGALNEARNTFSRFAAEYPDDPLVPGAIFEDLRISTELKDTARALTAARALYIEYPATEEAGRASGILPVPLRSLAPEERYRRGRNLFRSARYEDASVEFSSLLAEEAGKGAGAYLDDATVMLAVTRVRLKDYSGAEKTLRAYLSEKGPPGRELDALYWLALASVRQGKEKELLDVERELEKNYPKSPRRAGVLLFIGRHFESKGDAERAEKAYSRIMKEFRRKAAPDSREEAGWRLGWMSYRAGRYKEAKKIFSAYLRENPRGDQVDQFLYWSARCSERLGKYDEARAKYGRLRKVFSESYYSVMAEKRLMAGGSAVPSAEPARAGFSLKKRSRAMRSDPHMRAAEELIRLGLGDRAVPELDLLAERFSGAREAMFELATLYYRAGDFSRALGVHQRYFYGQKGAFGDGLLTLEDLSFPPRIVDVIRRAMPEGAIDPYLVAAVMREESRFDPAVVSRTGAVGLMQIMPSTGRFIATRLGEDSFEADDLFDPETNIRLGSWYLAHLASTFESNVILTVAGYNAGPGAARRWAEELPGEPDEFIESIPYKETRHYAKRVLRSYSEFLKGAGLDAGGLFQTASGEDL